MPAGTVTVEGTGKTVPFELVSVTARPAEPAGPLRVTVAVRVPDPPLIDSELSVKLVRNAGVTITDALALPFRVPVTETLVLVETPRVVKVAVPVLLPA